MLHLFLYIYLLLQVNDSYLDDIDVIIDGIYVLFHFVLHHVLLLIFYIGLFLIKDILFEIRNARRRAEHYDGEDAKLD